MGVQRKHPANEFKEEAVHLVTQNGLSLAKAARDLGYQPKHPVYFTYKKSKFTCGFGSDVSRVGKTTSALRVSPLPI